MRIVVGVWPLQSRMRQRIRASARLRYSLDVAHTQLRYSMHMLAVGWCCWCGGGGVEMVVVADVPPPCPSRAPLTSVVAHETEGQHVGETRESIYKLHMHEIYATCVLRVNYMCKLLHHATHKLQKSSIQTQTSSTRTCSRRLIWMETASSQKKSSSKPIGRRRC